jgi:hypothetical protein
MTISKLADHLVKPNLDVVGDGANRESEGYIVPIHMCYYLIELLP